MAKEYKYLFGPVPSRRFGRSLGVDLTPFKTCSFDCVFCQLGSTKKTLLERREYVPIDEVLNELRDWLERDGRADYITLSGSGEPTLHKHFGRVLEFVQATSEISSILMTNSSMLRLAEVRESAAKANIVKVSLSAWDQKSLDLINRPHRDLSFDEIVAGLKSFRREFSGEMHLEVFLVKGLNSTRADVARIATIANEIEPDIVQLNTAVRPPAEEISAVSREEMEKFAELFTRKTEVIANFDALSGEKIKATQESLYSMLKRHPCTAEHIGQVFGMQTNEVAKYIGNLMRAGKIKSERKSGHIYYFLKNSTEKS